MKGFKTGIFVFCIAVSMTFCASKNNTQTDFPQKPSAVYFQKWIGGRPETGGGTHFYIEFAKPLSKAIQLKKVYFQQQEAAIEKVDDKKYVANFISPDQKSDLIMNGETSQEYGNKAPEMQQPKFDLKPDEAVIEYTYKQKKRFYKISNIKEKQLIAYP